ncbi:hypothetical protein DPD72_08465 [Salmonella enterica subsp. salamae]|nr:hypothetical protein [Salmonella enterica subsp. salamae]EEF0861257.1 hypothetical protein [Salmonella enterica subsp. salamae]
MAIITSPLSATEVHKAKPAANPIIYLMVVVCAYRSPPQGQCSDWRAIFPARDFPALSVFHSAGDNPAFPGKDVH